MRSHEKISTSSLYHWMLGFGVPSTRTRNSIWHRSNELGHFCRAKLNHRTHSPPPPPKNRNDLCMATYVCHCKKVCRAA
jgi:hypothetical protein